MTTTDSDPTCPHCGQAFVREQYRDLHLGVEHPDALSAEERERYETAREAEEQELRLFRYKALGALVLLYFGFLLLYAFTLAGR